MIIFDHFAICPSHFNYNLYLQNPSKILQLYQLNQTHLQSQLNSKPEVIQMKTDSRTKYSQNGMALSSKRYSLSKSKKSELQRFLNSTFHHKDFNKKIISTVSAQFNPEVTITSPYQRLCMSKNTKKAEKKYNRINIKEKKRRGNKNRQINEDEDIQQMLKQDVKLRVLEAVQMGEWIELIRQYKYNKPKKQYEANIVLRQFEKILELKQSLQMRKYRLVSSIL